MKLSISLLCLSVLLSTQLVDAYVFNFVIDVAEGLVYFLFILTFGLNFVTPCARWFYIQFIEKYVEKASEEIRKVSKRVSERLSDAGRKVSEQMRT